MLFLIHKDELFIKTLRDLEMLYRLILKIFNNTIRDIIIVETRY